MRPSASVLLMSLLLSAFVLPARAARFSDVSAATRFSAEIEALARAGVLTGNPDGTFKPGGQVNRAAMLVMLYRARGLDPAAPKGGCGKDVAPGGWYEGAVCDALKNGYVKGYDGGLFKPEQAVTRAEALKMTFSVLGLPVTSLNNAAWAPSVFTDVSEKDWFVGYVSAALTIEMVPLEGEASMPTFRPNTPLLRGEAASLIHDAMVRNGWKPAAQSSSAAPAAASRRSQGAAASSKGISVKEVDFPFSDDGVFSGKNGMVYRFSLKSRVTADVLSSVTSGTLTCRLFKLKADGTSEEYYLGDQQDMKCVLRVTLEAGSYQLDLKPTEANVGFSVRSKTATGDGNDGFSEAKLLQPGKPKTGNMPVEDVADWYTFTLSAQGTRTVRLTNADRFQCIVYPVGAIDLFGFVGPECNLPYEYPAGTYVVGVVRGDTVVEQDYSIWFE